MGGIRVINSAKDIENALQGANFICPTSIEVLTRWLWGGINLANDQVLKYAEYIQPTATKTNIIYDKIYKSDLPILDIINNKLGGLKNDEILIIEINILFAQINGITQNNILFKHTIGEGAYYNSAEQSQTAFINTTYTPEQYNNYHHKFIINSGDLESNYHLEIFTKLYSNLNPLNLTPPPRYEIAFSNVIYSKSKYIIET